jgi:hypothetical protein
LSNGLSFCIITTEHIFPNQKIINFIFFQIPPKTLKMLKFLMLLVILALVVLLSSEAVDAWGAPHWGKTDYLWWARGLGQRGFGPQAFAKLRR